MTLDDIDITNLVWIDEFEYSTIEQNQDRSLTGGLIVQEGLKKFGRPITLSQSWLTKSVLKQIKSKEAQTNVVLTLTLDSGESHRVIFNRSNGAAVSAKPIYPHTNAPNDWQFDTTIRLLTVEPPQDTP